MMHIRSRPRCRTAIVLGRYKLAELISGITPKNRRRETEWGAARPGRILVKSRYLTNTGDLVRRTFDPRPTEKQAGPPEGRTTGVILADHVKSVDRCSRLAEKLGHCPADTVEEVRARLAPLLGY
jgi:hypothetical protein